MKGKILLIFLPIIVLLMGCSEDIDNSDLSKNEIHILEEKCSELKSYDKINCYIDIAYKFAEKSGNLSKCENFTNVESRDSCYLGFAEKLKDLNLCLKINRLNIGSKPPPIDYATRYSCYGTARSNNSNDCSIIPEKNARNYCYYGIANELNKLSICNKITNENLRKYCKVQLNPNSTVFDCNVFYPNSGTLYECYEKFYTDDIIISNCQYLYNNFFKNYKDICYDNYLLNETNYEICSSIDTPKEKIWCLERIKKNIANKNNDTDYCDEIQMNLDIRDECYSTIAYNLKNYKICYNINDISIKSDCFLKSAKNEDWIKPCVEIESLNKNIHFKLEECYFNIVDNTKDYQLLLSDIKKQKTGYYFIDEVLERIAIKENDISYCYQIEDEHINGRCISDYAQKEDNLELCETIQSDYWNLRCKGIPT